MKLMAKRLEIYRTAETFEAEPEMIASAIWDEKKQEIVWLSGKKHFIENITEYWVYNYLTGEEVQPIEGKKFFDALGTMCGAYISSKIVEE